MSLSRYDFGLVEIDATGELGIYERLPNMRI